MSINPTIQCGGPVCPCSTCPDDLPPAFTMSGDFQNTDPEEPECENCAGYDGLLLIQNWVSGGSDPDDDSGRCNYQFPDELETPCGDLFAGVSIDFQDEKVIMTISMAGVGNVAVWEKVIDVPCNAAQTLSFVSSTITDCIWPDEVTITPAVAP
jgi:hypothetical protein